MRVAVTGATGFVGRNLLGDLECAGIEVVPVSRRRMLDSRWRESPRLDRDTDPADWARSFADVDAVVHCAARAHVMKEHAADPLDTFRRVNRDGTVAMARGAALAGVRRIVFLSSVKVLGETTSGRRPFRNDDLPAPTDPYAISKAEAEVALGAEAVGLGFELVVLRPPLVYGPGVGGNVASLIQLIRRGLWMPFGKATGNRRSMIYTGNLSSAIVAALVAPAAAGGRFLVSDGHDLSTRGLLDALSTACGRPARLFSVPGPLVQAALRAAGRQALWSRLFGDLQVDIADTIERLDWQPRIGVEQGMAAMFANRAGAGP